MSFLEITYLIIFVWIGAELWAITRKIKAISTDIHFIGIKMREAIQPPALLPVKGGTFVTAITPDALPKAKPKGKGANRKPRTEEQKKRASEIAKARWAKKKQPQATAV